MKRVHLFVSGRVQGVWFRASAEEQAVRLGLGGWARNTRDGRVEAVFEGPDAAVDEAVAWCREGPRLARVEGVEVAEEPPEGDTAFRAR
ncbi:MAG: acylphosphatase [Actinomycetota bacterium]